MDIALLAMDNSNIQTNNAASLAVFKMAINSTKQNGEDMTEMLKSAEPNLGNNIDTMV